jgi:shikimate kinase
MHKKIFLIGLMGSGKTYWKNRLSKKYEIRGYDLDYIIETFEEKTIVELFEEFTETGFREIEAAALRMFQQNAAYILSTGGGTPCFHDNMDWMNQQGITIWLDVSNQLLTQRLMAEKEHRPLIKNLSDKEIANFINLQFWERLKYYEKATYRLQDGQINDASFKKIIESHE